MPNICLRVLIIAALLAAPAAFGATISVSGSVFNDLAGNGIKEGFDPGLAGWTVGLQGTGFTATTDANGDYTISGVTTGASYTLEVALQPGWIHTLPVAPYTYAFSAFEGVDVVGGVFGVFLTVSVSGTIYSDLDGNGSRSAGEPGLAGWTAQIPEAGLTAVTDASGNYTITGVGPGSFTLREIVPSGWLQTQPTAPDYYSFMTNSGINVVGGIFGDQFQGVPEPDSATLLFVGGGLLMLARRTLRKSA